MSEGKFRLLMGIWLVLALVAVQPSAIYFLMGVLLFEGITNRRVLMLISRVCNGADQALAEMPVDVCAISLEAERVQ